MNKEELNKLNVGEKLADILEYHYGWNGNMTVYKLIVYTCKRFLFYKYISKYEFPFYFNDKSLAEEYLKNIDKFEIKKYIEFDRGDPIGLCFSIIPKNIKTPQYTYKMRSPYTPGDIHLKRGEIWDGYVDCKCIKDCRRVYQHKDFLEIENIEKDALKEGTIGNRFSYKLQQIN